MGSKISAVGRAKLSQGIIRQKNYLRRSIRQKNQIGQIIRRGELSENYDGSSCWVRSCFCHLLLADNRRNSLETDFGREKSSKTQEEYLYYFSSYYCRWFEGLAKLWCLVVPQKNICSIEKFLGEMSHRQLILPTYSILRSTLFVRCRNLCEIEKCQP